MKNPESNRNLVDLEINKIILNFNKSLKVNIPNQIFDSKNYGDLFLKNKICFVGKSDNDFFTNNNIDFKKLHNFYLNIAKSGVGTIISGGFKLSINDSNSFLNSLAVNREYFKNLLSQIHEFGTKFFYTLDTAYGRADDKNLLLGVFNYSVGYYRSYKNVNSFCKKITDGKCNDIIEFMSNQAKFALDFGFDGIVINGDLFGLIGEFTSNETNRRKFGYFNQLEDFPQKLISKIRLKKSNCKIIYKITFDSFISEVYGEEKQNIKSTKKFQSNFSFEKFMQFLIKLINYGVDGFFINFGTYESEFLSVPSHFEDDSIFYQLQLKIINYCFECKIKNKFDDEVFFIYNNFLYDLPYELSIKENIIYDFSNQILADNKIIQKIIGNTNFTNCIRCGLCSGNNFGYSSTSCILCPDNDMKNNVSSLCKNSNLLDKKIEFDANLCNFQSNNSQIAVIGAGISGINAAIFLLKNGYKIDLYEKRDKLNYRSRQNEIFGYNYLLKKYNDDIEKQIFKYISEGKLKLYLNTEFNKNYLNKTNYSKIIIATGFNTKFSNIPGAVLPNVKSIYEILSNEKYFDNKKNIVIEAKSELSLELTQYLLIKNKKVTLLLSSLDFLSNMQNSKLTYYLFSLKRLNCNVIVLPKIRKIESDFVEILVDNGVINQDFRTFILNHRSQNNFNLQYRAKNIDMDTYIYEPDLVSNKKLYIDLVRSKYKGELFVVGNALSLYEFRDSIKTAYFVSKNI